MNRNTYRLKAWLITAGVLATIVGLPALAPAQPPKRVDSWYMGKHVAGVYMAGRDGIVYVACTYRGEFRHENNHEVFFRNVDLHKKKNNGVQSAAEANSVENGNPWGNQEEQLAPDVHAVIGWMNLRSNEYFFVGITRNAKNTYQYIDCKAQKSKPTSDFTSLKVQTNGHAITLHFANVRQLGIAWRISGPYPL